MAVTPGGRESRTGYRLLERAGAYSLLELQLHTGRTHQARVHMAWLGHPLLGDAVYGRPSPLLDRHFLHAHRLAFAHPGTGEPWNSFRRCRPTCRMRWRQRGRDRGRASPE